MIQECLYKTGRTTETTCGSYNGLEQCILLHQQDENAPDGYRTIATFSHSIALRYGKPFCDKGDSGSLVYESDGNVIGLLYGANERIDVWLFSLITEVFCDTKALTGTSEVPFP